MILSLYCSIGVLLVCLLFCLLRNKKLKKQMQVEKNDFSAICEIDNALWKNIHAYVLLVTKDFVVRKTNYFTLTAQEDEGHEKLVGELLRCKNGLDAGHCGMHEYCSSCPVRAAINKAFNEKKGFTDVEASMQLYLSDEKNDYVDCNVVVSAAYMFINNEDKLLLTVQDITKLKGIQHELTVAKQQAEDSDRQKSAFLANMSHEIRTPLNAIVGFSSLLANATTSEDKGSYLGIINHNSELLLQLINDILDLSKIEAGTLEFVYSEVEINQMLKDLENIFRMRVADAGTGVNVIFENEFSPCFIQTERNRISQVISNFLTNALKFTNEGSIRLGYEVREKDIYFYVTDTGMGIPEDYKNKIFDRFVKLNDKKQGTGLGLSISSMIIDKLGGKIGVISEENIGSTFWFTLPVKPIKKASIMEINEISSMNDSKSDESGNHKKTILIAEDMEDNYLLYEAVLSKKYELIRAHDGEEAISLFLKQEPDVILMDLRMPVVDGYQATEAIRQMSLSVPIIAVTAFAFPEDRKKVLSHGFTDYLSKPIKSDTLFEKLKAVGI